MLSKEELLEYPDYLLEKYQNDIYREVITYMHANNLNQTDLAKKLNVSNSYISQVLNGNFNFTLKKLIELALAIGKVPKISFVTTDDFWGYSVSNKCLKVEFTIDGVTQAPQALDNYSSAIPEYNELILS